MLTVQVARFANELSAFAAALPRPDLAAPLTALARDLPPLAQGQPRVQSGGALALALHRAADLLATTGQEGAAPQRFVGRLESHLQRLFEVGIGLPAHQQRPRPHLRVPVQRSLRGPQRSPGQALVAFG